MEAVQKLNPTDAQPHHVVSSQDRPHHFTASGIFECPFGRGRHWLSSPPGWLNRLAGGWSVQSIYMFQSGPPINFPNVIFMGNIKDIPLLGDQRSVERWFNTNAGFERDSTKQLDLNIRTFPPRPTLSARVGNSTTPSSSTRATTASLPASTA